MAQVYQYKYDSEFVLESGKKIPGFHLGYSTFGKLNADKSNVIWIFHALTANSDPTEWWPGIVGEGKLFDPNHHFVICVNMPNSCYGSSQPLDINPTTGKQFLHDFPLFTTRDMVLAFDHLRLHLGIEKIAVGIGASMGGQQLLQWVVEAPDLFEFIIPIATNAVHSAWGIAFNSSQRWAIESDPTWLDGTETAGVNGMKVARSMALLSYRNYETYRVAQEGYTSSTESNPVDSQVFRAQTYQYYQGEKLAERFNAYSYYLLSKAMDAHNIGRGRGGVQKALESIKAQTLVIGVSSDILFPPAEQLFIADHVHNATCEIIDSLYGHDGFLLENETLTDLIRNFIKNASKRREVAHTTIY